MCMNIYIYLQKYFYIDNIFRGEKQVFGKEKSRIKKVLTVVTIYLLAFFLQNKSKWDLEVTNPPC